MQTDGIHGPIKALLQLQLQKLRIFVHTAAQHTAIAIFRPDIHGVGARQFRRLFSLHCGAEIPLQFHLIVFLGIAAQGLDLLPAQGLLVQLPGKLLQCFYQLGGIQGLEEIVAHSQPHGLYGVLKLIVPAEHQQLCIGQDVRQTFQKLQPVYMGHGDIGKHSIGQSILSQFQCFPSIPGQSHHLPTGTVAANKIRHPFPDTFFIVRYQ